MNKELLKSILEENIVKFKEDANNILKQKTSERLKQEYINVSKNLLSVNESAAEYILTMNPEYENSNFLNNGKGYNPFVDNSPTETSTATLGPEFDPDGPEPQLCDYISPCGKTNPHKKGTPEWEEWDRAKRLYNKHLKQYQKIVDLWDDYYKALKKWKERVGDGRHDPGPKPEKPTVGPPRDYIPPSPYVFMTPERNEDYA